VGKDYAVYKGDNFICLGSVKECAEFMGVNPNSIFFYASPAYKKRLEKTKNPRDPIIVIKLDDE
jgi:hypothetical protein